MNRNLDALVVGAGPVGLFTAILLAQRKLKIEIIDKAHAPSARSYALVLHPETLHLLAHVGLADEVIAAGYRIEKVGFYEGSIFRAGVQLGKLETRFPFAIVLPQGELERLLIRRLDELGVRVQWDHELAAFKSKNDEIQAEVHRFDEVPQGYPILDLRRMVTKTYHVTTAFLIGTDGYHSTVRRYQNIEYTSHGPHHYYSLYEFQTAEDMNHEVRFAIHDHFTSALWPMPDGRCRWTFEIEAPEQHDPSPEKLRAFVEERAPWFEHLPAEVDWSACARFEPRLAEQFGEDRVWLAGDAAHLTMPHAAQSMNMGIREAHDLAWRIFEVLRNNATPEIMLNYHRQAAAEWHILVQQDGHLKTEPDANQWTKPRAKAIATCIPATGEDFDNLLLQLGIQTN